MFDSKTSLIVKKDFWNDTCWKRNKLMSQKLCVQILTSSPSILLIGTTYAYFDIQLQTIQSSDAEMKWSSLTEFVLLVLLK